MSRYYRSTREAFPCERFPATFGPYRRDTFTRQLLRAVACLGCFALIGAIVGASF